MSNRSSADDCAALAGSFRRSCFKTAHCLHYYSQRFCERGLRQSNLRRHPVRISCASDKIRCVSTILSNHTNLAPLPATDCTIAFAFVALTTPLDALDD